MFGKIKDKLKGLFAKTEDIIDEDPDEVLEIEDKVEEKKPRKAPVKKKTVVKKEEVKTKSQVKPKPKSKTPIKTPSKTKVKTKEEEKKPLVGEVEEDNEELAYGVEAPEEESAEKPQKKGFFSKVFGLGEDEDSEEELEALPAPQKKEITKSQKKELVEKEEENQGIISKTFKKLKSKKITREDFEKIWLELEMFLLEINIAYEIVEKIGEKLREALIGNSFDRFKLTEKIREVMAKEVEEVLSAREADFLEVLKDYKSRGELLKILVLGVNGTGKTTSIGKIVRFMQKNDFKLVVAASDTFRAAAIEQLDEHAKKLDFKLIQHKGEGDPAAVAFDAIEHAKAKNLDVVLIDTAGRMPNNSNLMMELQKVKKVSEAQMALFVGDSVSGNDLIDQIELFDMGVKIDGVILTKVDTDERPGSIVTTAYSIEKPIYFLGTGQTYDDLIKFDAKEVATKLFSIDDED